MPNHTLRALTGARFFAAALVVWYHLAKDVPFGRSGYAAVGFFFLLSGFVMAYSYTTREGYLRGDAVSFWSARIARIYPAYLFAFLIAAPFDIANSMHVNGGAVASAKLLFGGATVLSLVQAWTPWTAWYWNYPAWSLSAEAFFYLLFPLAVPYLTRLSRRQCIWLMPALWVCALAAPILFTAQHRSLAYPAYGSAQLAIEVNPLLRLPEFLFGLLLGRTFQLGRISNRGAARLAWVGIAGAAVVLASSSWIPRPLIAGGLAAPFSAMSIFGLAHGAGSLAKLLSLRPIVLLGDASYGVYILQVPVALLFGIDGSPSSPVRIAFYTLALIGLSVAFFKYIEQPLRPSLRTKLLSLFQAGETRVAVRGVA